MKHFKYLMNSGMIGIAVGMIWLAVDFFLSPINHDLHTEKIPVSYFFFWLIVSFMIGVFFNLAGWIFNNDNWSLRKQITINFFICLIAWLLFVWFLNNLQYTWSTLLVAFGNFIIMYAIAYGTYIYHLYVDVKKINKKLKQNRG